jgi:5'-3' exonuclease
LQFELVERATAALGLVVWPMVEFEADDAIATAAAALARDPRVDQVRIVSPDKDMCQCVEGAKVVCWERWKDIVLDEPAVVAKHGVSPESIADMLALVGDTADGIPGLEGWGKSSAGKVLTVYRHIEAIPDDPTKWNVPGLRGIDRLAASLREHRAEAALYKKLATLRIDCPITTDADALAWKGVNRAALDAILAEIGMPADAIKLCFENVMPSITFFTQDVVASGQSRLSRNKTLALPDASTSILSRIVVPLFTHAWSLAFFAFTRL